MFLYIKAVIGVNQDVVYEKCDTLTEARKVDSIMKLAEEAGMSTGFISTMRVTHATPANLYSSAPSRYWESDKDLPSDAKDCKDIGMDYIIVGKGRRGEGLGEDG